MRKMALSRLANLSSKLLKPTEQTGRKDCPFPIPVEEFLQCRSQSGGLPALDTGEHNLTENARNTVPQLTEQERQEIIRFIDADKPLSDKYRFLSFTVAVGG